MGCAIGILIVRHLETVELATFTFVDAELLVDSRREYGVDLIDPTRPDYRRQSRAGEGFAASDFTIDWDQQHATCPEGRTSVSWSPAVDRGHNDVIKIKFSAKDCGACPARARCTEAKRRSITVRSRDQYEALHAARSREASEEYRSDYKRRAGIEGTISQGVRTCGLRRSRYIGEVKAHLQHVATVAAINVTRIATGYAAGQEKQPCGRTVFSPTITGDKNNEKRN